MLNNKTKTLGIVFIVTALSTLSTSKTLAQTTQPVQESEPSSVQLNQPTASPSVSPSTTPSVPLSPGAISAQDRQFVMMASQGGMAEIELGKLALQKASTSAVKNFGQHMIKDHTQANNQLKQLAAQKRITLAVGVSEQDRATKARLSKLSGAAFNQELMNQMVMDHEKTVALFERQSQQGSDPDLKAWATQTLPTLKGHLRTALAVQRNVAYKPSSK